MTNQRLNRELDQIFRAVCKKTWGSTPQCISCSLIGRWYAKDNPFGIQVGHYYSRSVYPLRWNLNNCFPQCAICNQQHETNMKPMRDGILRTTGQAHLDWLDAQYALYRKSGKTMKKYEKEEVLAGYQELLQKYPSVKTGI